MAFDRFLRQAEKLKEENEALKQQILVLETEIGRQGDEAKQREDQLIRNFEAQYEQSQNNLEVLYADRIKGLKADLEAQDKLLRASDAENLRLRQEGGVDQEFIERARRLRDENKALRGKVGRLESELEGSEQRADEKTQRDLEHARQLDEQIARLEAQIAQRDENYKKQVDDLEDKVSVQRRAVTRLEGQLKSNEKEAEDYIERITELQEGRQVAQNALAAAQDQHDEALANMQEQLAQAQQDNQVLQVQVDTLRREKERLEGQMGALEVDVESGKNRLNDLQRKLDETADERDELTDEALDAQKRYKGAQQQLQQRELEIAGIKQQTDQIQQKQEDEARKLAERNIQLEAQIVKLSEEHKKQVSDLQFQVEAKGREVERLKDALGKPETDQDELLGTALGNEKALRAAKDELAQLRVQFALLQQDNARLQQLQQQITQELTVNPRNNKSPVGSGNDGNPLPGPNEEEFAQHLQDELTKKQQVPQQVLSAGSIPGLDPNILPDLDLGSDVPGRASPGIHPDLPEVEPDSFGLEALFAEGGGVSPPRMVSPPPPPPPQVPGVPGAGNVPPQVPPLQVPQAVKAAILEARARIFQMVGDLLPKDHDALKGLLLNDRNALDALAKRAQDAADNTNDESTKKDAKRVVVAEFIDKAIHAYNKTALQTALGDIKNLDDPRALVPREIIDNIVNENRTVFEREAMKNTVAKHPHLKADHESLKAFLTSDDGMLDKLVQQAQVAADQFPRGNVQERKKARGDVVTAFLEKVIAAEDDQTLQAAFDDINDHLNQETITAILDENKAAREKVAKEVAEAAQAAQAPAAVDDKAAARLYVLSVLDNPIVGVQPPKRDIELEFANKHKALRNLIAAGDANSDAAVARLLKIVGEKNKNNNADMMSQPGRDDVENKLNLKEAVQYLILNADHEEQLEKELKRMLGVENIDLNQFRDILKENRDAACEYAALHRYDVNNPEEAAALQSIKSAEKKTRMRNHEVSASQYDATLSAFARILERERTAEFPDIQALKNLAARCHEERKNLAGIGKPRSDYLDTVFDAFGKLMEKADKCIREGEKPVQIVEARTGGRKVLCASANIAEVNAAFDNYLQAASSGVMSIGDKQHLTAPNYAVALPMQESGQTSAKTAMKVTHNGGGGGAPSKFPTQVVGEIRLSDEAMAIIKKEAGLLSSSKKVPGQRTMALAESYIDELLRHTPPSSKDEPLNIDCEALPPALTHALVLACAARGQKCDCPYFRKPGNFPDQVHQYLGQKRGESNKAFADYIQETKGLTRGPGA